MDEGKRGDLSGPSNVEGPSAHASLGESGENLLGSNSGLADDNEQVDNGPGIYAIPVPSFAGEWTGIPATNLIPIKYNVPTVISSAGGDNGDTRQEGEQQQQQQQGQVVRRFHFAIQIDLMLIFKLAAVVILFNQEGSRQRLVLLILFASIIYLKPGHLRRDCRKLAWKEEQIKKGTWNPGQHKKAYVASEGEELSAAKKGEDGGKIRKLIQSEVNKILQKFGSTSLVQSGNRTEDFIC
ncbi:uncharacterized protein LOC144715432 isoform X2 [Wolffia australiana]